MFGNLFGQSSTSQTTDYLTSSSYNTSDSNNVSISSPTTLDNAFNATLNLNQGLDWNKWAPLIGIAAAALLAIALILRK
jgi:hypothetical protein